MTSGNDYPKHLSYSDGKETDSSSVRSRAAKNAVHQANILLTEQSRLQRKQRKVLYRTELFFALLSAGLAWNLWKTRQTYNQCKEKTELELARLKQERDAVQFQLTCVRSSLESQLEPIAEHLFDIASHQQNTTFQVRQKRKEALYKWVQQAVSQKL